MVPKRRAGEAVSCRVRDASYLESNLMHLGQNKISLEILFCFFKTSFCCVSQTGLELSIVLSQTPGRVLGFQDRSCQTHIPGTLLVRKYSESFPTFLKYYVASC